MHAPLQKYSQNSLRMLGLLLLLLPACAKPTSGVIVPEHRADTVQKTTSQKLRQRCYSSTTDKDVNDPSGVKICVWRPTKAKDANPWTLSNDPRKFNISHTKAKDSSIQEVVSLDASVKFFAASSGALTPDQQTQAFNLIKNQCLPNINYFWSKHDINLKLNLVLNADRSSVDQELSVEYVALPASKTPGDLNYSFQIEQWSQIPQGQLVGVTSDECAKKAASGLPSEQDQVRSSCMKTLNQPFCLAMNKMIGHWLGAEDKTDLRCYDKVAVENELKKLDADPKKTDPISTDETTFTSFMGFLVNPQPTASTPAVTTPVADTKTDTPATTTPSGSTKKVNAADVQQSQFAVAAAAYDQGLKEAAVASVVADGTSDADSARPVPPKVDTPTPASVPDQSKDPSYEKWLTLKITKAELAEIFACDMTKAIKTPVPAETSTATTPRKPPVPQQQAQQQSQQQTAKK